METNEWGLEKLHERMLQILKSFDNICAENGIEYCLAYGSALGAERHGGFIPWDDDVDVYMDFKDFPRFKAAFQTSPYAKGLHLQELYKLNDIGTLIKIRMDGTTFIEELFKDKDIHHGIYIDIFLLTGGADRRLTQKLEDFGSKYVAIKRLADSGYSRRKSYAPALKFLRLFPEKFLCNGISKKLYKRDSEKTGLYREPDKDSALPVYPRAWLFPPKRVSFNGIELNVPAENKKYLQTLYGNYMEIPKIDRIKWKQHAAFWDAEENYDKYIKTTNRFLDEK